MREAFNFIIIRFYSFLNEVALFIPSIYGGLSQEFVATMCGQRGLISICASIRLL